MKNSAFVYFAFSLLIACHPAEKKFDKTGWAKSDAGMYYQREEMLNDVMKNHLKKGMSFQETVHLLGKSQDSTLGFSDFTILYDIVVDDGSDIDPVAGKDLFMSFSKDSMLIAWEVKEWDK
jgi:hypothetical protein